MFYNARWYDPYLNYFTQPDTIVPNPYNSQDWDRYSYARNNPVRYNDPSGHSVDCGLGESGCNAGTYTPPPNQGDDEGLHGGASATIPDGERENIPIQEFNIDGVELTTEKGSWPNTSHSYTYHFNGDEMDLWIMDLHERNYLIEDLILIGALEDLPGWLGIPFDHITTPSDVFTNTARDFYFNTNRNGEFEVKVLTRLAVTNEGYDNNNNPSGLFGVEFYEETTGNTQRMAISELYFEFFFTLSNQQK